MTRISVHKQGMNEFLEEYKHQNKGPIEQKLNSIIMSRPFGSYPFYVFCFLKKNMKGDNANTMFYQARLTKPEPSDNTMLFRCHPGDPEKVEVMWILPNEQSINLFKKGKYFAHEMIHDFIKQYLTNRQSMRIPEDGDAPDHYVKDIYRKKYNLRPTLKIP